MSACNSNDDDDDSYSMLGSVASTGGAATGFDSLTQTRLTRGLREGSMAADVKRDLVGMGQATEFCLKKLVLPSGSREVRAAASSLKQMLQDEDLRILVDQRRVVEVLCRAVQLHRSPNVLRLALCIFCTMVLLEPAGGADYPAETARVLDRCRELAAAGAADGATDAAVRLACAAYEAFKLAEVRRRLDSSQAEALARHTAVLLTRTASTAASAEAWDSEGAAEEQATLIEVLTALITTAAAAPGREVAAAVVAEGCMRPLVCSLRGPSAGAAAAEQPTAADGVGAATNAQRLALNCLQAIAARCGDELGMGATAAEQAVAAGAVEALVALMKAEPEQVLQLLLWLAAKGSDAAAERVCEMLILECGRLPRLRGVFGGAAASLLRSPGASISDSTESDALVLLRVAAGVLEGAPDASGWVLRPGGCALLRLALAALGARQEPPTLRPTWPAASDVEGGSDYPQAAAAEDEPGDPAQSAAEAGSQARPARSPALAEVAMQLLLHLLRATSAPLRQAGASSGDAAAPGDEGAALAAAEWLPAQPSSLVEALALDAVGRAPFRTPPLLALRCLDQCLRVLGATAGAQLLGLVDGPGGEGVMKELAEVVAAHIAQQQHQVATPSAAADGAAEPISDCLSADGAVLLRLAVLLLRLPHSPGGAATSRCIAPAAEAVLRWRSVRALLPSLLVESTAAHLYDTRLHGQDHGSESGGSGSAAASVPATASTSAEGPSLAPWAMPHSRLALHALHAAGRVLAAGGGLGSMAAEEVLSITEVLEPLLQLQPEEGSVQALSLLVMLATAGGPSMGDRLRASAVSAAGRSPQLHEGGLRAAAILLVGADGQDPLQQHGHRAFLLSLCADLLGAPTADPQRLSPDGATHAVLRAAVGALGALSQAANRMSSLEEPVGGVGGGSRDGDEGNVVEAAARLVRLVAVQLCPQLLRTVVPDLALLAAIAAYEHQASPSTTAVLLCLSACLDHPDLRREDWPPPSRLLAVGDAAACALRTAASSDSGPLLHLSCQVLRRQSSAAVGARRQQQLPAWALSLARLSAVMLGAALKLEAASQSDRLASCLDAACGALQVIDGNAGGAGTISLAQVLPPQLPSLVLSALSRLCANARSTEEQGIALRVGCLAERVMEMQGLLLEAQSRAELEAQKAQGAQHLRVALQAAATAARAELEVAKAQREELEVAKAQQEAELEAAKTQQVKQKEALALLAASMDEDGCTALHVASYEGHAQALEALLQAGADVEALDKYGASALYIASKNGRTEAVKALLRAGAGTKSKTREQDVTCGRVFIALNIASHKGYTAVVEALLQAGADTEAKEPCDITALHIAAQCNHTEVVEALLRAGADKEAKTEYSHGTKTALHLACHSGHKAVVEALLRAGANKDARDTGGYTPLENARRNNRDDVAGWLSR